jgi:hypothetical protein
VDTFLGCHLEIIHCVTVAVTCVVLTNFEEMVRR